MAELVSICKRCGRIWSAFVDTEDLLSGTLACKQCGQLNKVFPASSAAVAKTFQSLDGHTLDAAEIEKYLQLLLANVPAEGLDLDAPDFSAKFSKLGEVVREHIGVGPTRTQVLLSAAALLVGLVQPFSGQRSAASVRSEVTDEENVEVERSREVTLNLERKVVIRDNMLAFEYYEPFANFQFSATPDPDALEKWLQKVEDEGSDKPRTLIDPEIFDVVPIGPKFRKAKY